MLFTYLLKQKKIIPQIMLITTITAPPATAIKTICDLTPKAGFPLLDKISEESKI